MEHIKGIINDFLFNKWFDENIEELRIKWAENGADREMDFNEEDELEKEFNDFMNTLRKQCVFSSFMCNLKRY